MKNLAILGSSGSIGRQTLNVVRRYPELFNVKALTVNSDVETLLQQVKEFRPDFVGVCDQIAYREAAAALPAGVSLLGGEGCLQETAALDGVDMVVAAVVGMCGLSAVMSALSHGKDVALANKEALVAGGCLVTAAAKRYKRELLPVDSEHSAVWQCLNCGKKEEVKRIILTASGGSFYNWDKSQLKNVTPKMAVQHPNWKMGKKISVDSSSMMNKALELIEARWLFDTKNVDYVIHPQSVIHSMVEYCDGSIAAQLAAPNMELPIQTALTFPDRLPMKEAEFAFDKQLTFAAPDEKKFPLPRLARQAMEMGGNAPCVFNAAGEACVKLFLDNKISFTDINFIVEDTLLKTENILSPALKEIYATHTNVYGKLMRDYN